MLRRRRISRAACEFSGAFSGVRIERNPSHFARREAFLGTFIVVSPLAFTGMLFCSVPVDSWMMFIDWE